MAHSKYTHLLSQWSQGIHPSAIQKALARPARNSISFSLGLPDTRLFPFHRYKEEILRLSAHEILQYTPPLKQLKASIVTLMKQRQVNCTASQVFLTTGAQQGLSLLARLFLNVGDQIIAEELTYPGFLQAVSPYAPDFLLVPTHPMTGMDLQALEQTLTSNKSIKFIYTICDGHNPLGVSLSTESRQRLAELSAASQTFVIEDDPYGFLNYEELRPPLFALNPNYTCYVGSFSKVLAPAFRLGWLIVPEDLVPKLSTIKEAFDLNTATFSQHVVLKILQGEGLNRFLDEQLVYIKTEYKKRRDVMLQSLGEFFPAGTQVHVPTHGIFIWVTLPKHFDTEKIFYYVSDKAKVTFMPGNAFTVDQNNHATHCMRLNFSYHSPSKIQEGIQRLGRTLKRLAHIKVI